MQNDLDKKEEEKQSDISLPVFQRPFRVRVREGWDKFLRGEEKLRELIDQKAGSEMIAEYFADLLAPAFENVFAEVGFNGEKYELILNLEGSWSRLFSMTYFQRHAPEEVRKHWNILVGRQSREYRTEEEWKYGVQISGNTVYAGEIQIWTEWENKEAKVFIYCEKLLPLLQERENEAYHIAYIMLDYAIGELAEMKYICELHILDAPHERAPLSMAQLLPHFMENLSLGREELFDAGRYCEMYCGYRMRPDEEAHDGLRRDVIVGSGCFMSLLNEFWHGETYSMDAYHKDGIVAGYFCFPLYGFEGDDKSTQILDFRDDSAEMIEKTAGLDSFTYIGGATGIYYGYLDFIAWDLKAVLDAAAAVFEKSGPDWVMFHSFRQEAKGIMLFKRNKG